MNELETLFQEQYRLNITESIEIRYRTEEQTVTTIDPETGEEISYGELVESTEIPDDVIFNHYDGILFTDDDFFCSCGK